MSTPLSPHRWTRFVFLTVTLFISLAAFAAQTEHVIIRSTGSRQQLKQKVQALGGTIHYEFKNVTAVSATIPASSMAALNTVPEFKLSKTSTVYTPTPRAPRGISKGVVTMHATGKVRFDPNTLIKNAQKLPTDYLFNNTLINAT